ncbi:hypothetical protein [Sanguibacter suaedae]|uniref:Uncharacterized protein n=1 Tax=Sanguibacter suaedae TaxID=2795737 RepID=A0A934I0W6_9MICO|nr:hypothetical protein [Sanguibacter suaedae]MBI9113524.1 hypothetical protein [Sanguibacter suaedae]
MTTNSVGTGSYPVPPVPVTRNTRDADADAVEPDPEEATTGEVAEERDVVANLDDPEVAAAIEDLRPDAK